MSLEESKFWQSPKIRDPLFPPSVYEKPKKKNTSQRPKRNLPKSFSSLHLRKPKSKFTISPKTKPLQNFVLKFPPSKIPPLCMPSPASPLSSPPLSRYPLPMAVLFLSQDDNKENIPPFSPKQATLITKSKSPLPTGNKRRVRRPLEDITTLFNPEIYSTSALDNRIYIFHSLPSACKVRSGKRRAEDGVYPTCKKTTQLLHSSKNFR
jgi:hypothetical protein